MALIDYLMALAATPPGQQPKPQPVCGSCIYFCPKSVNAVTGECRAHPPSPEIRMIRAQSSNWATVKTTDWCGEYANK